MFTKIQILAIITAIFYKKLSFEISKKRKVRTINHASNTKNRG
jgi:hypothetical protein